MRKPRPAPRSSLLLPIILGLAGIACTQPRKACTTGSGPTPFAAKYTLKQGSKTGTGDCDTLIGEKIGLEKYNPAREDNPEKEDFTKADLAIQSATLGELAGAAADAGVPDQDPNHKLYSLGAFADAMPDDNDVCRVASLSPAEQSIAAIPADPDAGTTGQPVDIKYEWSNVRLYVTARAPGTQMVADLKFTKDGCSASYSVVGVWPAVSCAVVDDGGMATGIDPSLCTPPGSGINPDFKENITCDKDLKLCVLKAPPPELK